MEDVNVQRLDILMMLSIKIEFVNLVIILVILVLEKILINVELVKWIEKYRMEVCVFVKITLLKILKVGAYAILLVEYKMQYVFILSIHVAKIKYL